MSTLTVRHVAKSYGRIPVLHGVNLDVEHGAITAILGPSGCGKTTLLRIIAGFETIDSGIVEVAGRVVNDGRRRVAPNKRNIGYVAQEGALFPHLSVEANICFGLPWRDRLRRRRVGELLELVSLDAGLAKRSPHELSGGQQQRVAVARCLARRPRLVLLDEPFSALDTGLRQATRDAIARALRAAGVTTILVTHDQQEAMSFADDVAVMREGRFTQIGPGAQLYRQPADVDTALLLGPATVLSAYASSGIGQTALGTLRLMDPSAQGDVQVVIRPEQLSVSTASRGSGVPATVTAAAFHGSNVMVTAQLHDAPGTAITARAPGDSSVGTGDLIEVAVLGAVHAIPASTARVATISGERAVSVR